MLVLYHGGCNDGFAAAWIARMRYPACECVPVYYGGTIPDVDNLDVLMLDFCFPEQVMELLKKVAKSLFVIDHHKTSKDVAGKYGIYDETMSGAMLTWNYLFPKDPVPEFIQYIQDYDLWKFELPQSRAWSAGLGLYPRDFKVWEELEKQPTAHLIRRGVTVMEYQQQLVNAQVKQAVMRDILGYRVPCTNATVLIDLTGERMCAGHPFSASYYDRADGKRKWSLRSDANGIDVGKLAEKIPGGGGHKNAAGFETLNPDLEIK